MESPCLLLVDDEPALANLLKKYLERLGYQVDACTHPDAALKLLDENPGRYAAAGDGLNAAGYERRGISAAVAGAELHSYPRLSPADIRTSRARQGWSFCRSHFSRRCWRRPCERILKA